MNDLTITVSPPNLISQAEGPHWFPTMLFRLSDGGLLLGFSVCADELPGNIAGGMPHALLKSLDNGHNWACQTIVTGRLYGEAFPYGMLADGRMLGILGGASGILLDENGTPYSLEYVSTDGARTWEGPHKTPIVFPQEQELGKAVVAPGRTLVPFAFEGNLIERRNGTLLRVVDGKLAGDSHTRIGIMQSTDGARSWSYLSTVTDQSTAPLDFNESALLEVSDGELICVMRSDGDSRGNVMFQARSLDGGRTWSRPASLGHNGVRPQMVRLRNGTIACSYGRLSGWPSAGVQVMFSRDGGASWVQHTTIHEKASTGYTALLEVRPNELMLVYDQLGYGWSRVNSINSVRISVNTGDSTE